MMSSQSSDLPAGHQQVVLGPFPSLWRPRRKKTAWRSYRWGKAWFGRSLGLWLSCHRKMEWNSCRWAITWCYWRLFYPQEEKGNELYKV